MEAFLAAHYDIQVKDRTMWNGLEGFQDDKHVYFITYAGETEAIHMEQSALAYYYYENHHRQVAIPVRNKQGDWFSTYQDTPYMVWRVDNRPWEAPKGSHGERLAWFHRTGAAYPSRPPSISNYGQWKDLWIRKLTTFEKEINSKSYNTPNAYHRLLMDLLPYLIGISENAIQYVQESESERRFHDVDQGTVVFARYHGQLDHSLIWGTDFAFDHPTRDLAEYSRYLLLNAQDPMQDVALFLTDYQRVRPLSIFSWRLLFARLLYPIHLFDVIGRGFVTGQYEKAHTELLSLLQTQPLYEKRLGAFFANVGIDWQALEIPMLHWL